uniref:Rege-1 UBA-like domain-containing protein n=1 Tax=Octopus bimaculoides TaxID=37653 RepID=A0A0L8FI48_OCTBM
MVSAPGTLKTESLGNALYLDYVNKTQSKSGVNFMTDISSSCVNKCLTGESDEDGDSDDNINGMLENYNTPDFKQKMDYVIRLGYTVDQFKTVWKKLGPKKENDVLLAELLKLTDGLSMKSVKDHYSEMEHNSSPSTESAASVTEKSSLSKDTINKNPDDSDNLRMIVIDGSNVAMLYVFSHFSL